MTHYMTKICPVMRVIVIESCFFIVPEGCGSDKLPEEGGDEKLPEEGGDEKLPEKEGGEKLHEETPKGKLIIIRITGVSHPRGGGGE